VTILDESIEAQRKCKHSCADADCLFFSESFTSEDPRRDSQERSAVKRVPTGEMRICGSSSPGRRGALLKDAVEQVTRADRAKRRRHYGKCAFAAVIAEEVRGGQPRYWQNSLLFPEITEWDCDLLRFSIVAR